MTTKFTRSTTSLFDRLQVQTQPVNETDLLRQEQEIQKSLVKEIPLSKEAASAARQVRRGPPRFVSTRALNRKRRGRFVVFTPRGGGGYLPARGLPVAVVPAPTPKASTTATVTPTDSREPSRRPPRRLSPPVKVGLGVGAAAGGLLLLRALF